MEIILLCPGGLATGGTEGIHNLARYLTKVGADAKILYTGTKIQPKEFNKYNCKTIPLLPDGYKGVVILPEVWANQVLDDCYRDCTVAVNWQGVDVYDWHTPVNQRNKFLERKDVIHIVNSEYALHHIRGLGLEPIKISDCLNDDFFEPMPDIYNRKDTVLYNPVSVKMTHFQETVMARCNTELGIKFQMIEGLSRQEVIDLFRHHKLYIDFGVFSGRERLPREAVMCGCCILTSTKGTAGYFKDNSILDKYKTDDVTDAMQMIHYIIGNYNTCKTDFNMYRDLLREDKKNYISEVKELYDAILNHITKSQR